MPKRADMCHPDSGCGLTISVRREFDHFLGAQACKALRVKRAAATLGEPNPATIKDRPGMAGCDP